MASQGEHEEQLQLQLIELAALFVVAAGVVVAGVVAAGVVAVWRTHLTKLVVVAGPLASVF